HGRKLAKRLKVRRRDRLSETWPLPTGVWTAHEGQRAVDALRFARGRGAYSQGALEGNLVLLDVLNRVIRDSRLAVLQDGGDVDRLPSDGRLSGGGVRAFNVVGGGSELNKPWRRRRCP